MTSFSFLDPDLGKKRKKNSIFLVYASLCLKHAFFSPTKEYHFLIFMYSLIPIKIRAINYHNYH